MSALDKFHAHLDVCEQCRERPFGLCPVGVPLLLDAGREAAKRIGLDPGSARSSPETSAPEAKP